MWIYVFSSRVIPAIVIIAQALPEASVGTATAASESTGYRRSGGGVPW